MDRISIINELYKDKDVNDAFNKMNPQHLVEDLRQEVFLVLCEMDELRLIELYDKKVIKYFIVRIILNMIQSNTSEFYRKYRKEYTELITDIEDQQDNQFDYDRIQPVIDKLHWYEREMIILYSEMKNIKTISKETNIPYRSILKTISKIKVSLKKELRNG